MSAPTEARDREAIAYGLARRLLGWQGSITELVCLLFLCSAGERGLTCSHALRLRPMNANQWLAMAQGWQQVGLATLSLERPPGGRGRSCLRYFITEKGIALLRATLNF